MVSVSPIVECLDRKKGKYFVILLWLIATGLAAGLGAFKFSDNTKDTFLPTKNLQSFNAYTVVSEKFPSYLTEDVEIVYIKAKPGASVVSNATRSLCYELGEWFQSQKDPAVKRVESYYTFADNPELSPLKYNYITQDESAMIVAIGIDSRMKSPNLIPNAIKKVTDLADSYKQDTAQVILTGRLTIAKIEDDYTGQGFALGDGIGLPFIAIVFWYNVGAFRLLIVPALALACSLILSYGVGLGLAKSIAIPSYEPNIVLFLCLSLSIDYSFFLLTRFQEELQNGEKTEDAVEASLQHSGGTVLVSGLVLVVTWFADLFFPVFGLDACGVVSGLTVLICVVVNLTLCPSLLLTFPNFFSNGGFSMCEKCPCCKRRERDMTKKIGCYEIVAEKATKFPGSIILPLLVYAGFLVGCLQLIDLKLVLAANISFGRKDEPTAKAFVEAGQVIRSDVFQSTFAIVATNTGPIMTPEYFNTTCAVARELTKVYKISTPTLKGVSFQVPFGGLPECYTTEEALAALNSTNVYSHNYNLLTNPTDPKTSLITFAVQFNPFSTEVKNVVNDVRTILDNQRGDVEYHFYHPMAPEVDGASYVADRFVWVVAVILIAVFAVIAVRFRAAFIPFKLFLTVVVPIIFVYGLAVAVYQKGSATSGPFKSTGGISWLTPVANVFLLLGLALDYDIFLFSRVYEIRRTGKVNTREAIVQAVTITGPVISGAGIIMALAFTGMLVSSISFLNQFGFAMILGVLLDTFIVRIVLVPAFLSLGDCLNWWPGKMPPVEQGLLAY